MGKIIIICVGGSSGKTFGNQSYKVLQAQNRQSKNHIHHIVISLINMKCLRMKALVALER